jgi:cytochrome c peroxidase
MKKSILLVSLLAGVIVLIISCSKNNDTTVINSEKYPFIKAAFGDIINPDNLTNYSNQALPVYITKNNSVANPVTNSKSTLGRVLFYDKNLSINNTVSCGSCHKQEFAFSDTALASAGVEGGLTGRHSMRLINAKFANEVRFFWDERAASLELQTTAPIKDHAEMGFSGLNGRPTFATLLSKLQAIGYYQELFKFVYGDENVTEARIQDALANFIRSIQSFDSKYDAGRVNAPNDGAPFANFTASENQGKNLFLAPPQFGPGGIRIGGGAGCGGCHAAPELDINPASRNNGVIGSFAGTADLIVTRSPSLRDILRTNGSTNGAFMHNGSLVSSLDVINHYNQISNTGNNNLDPRLMPGGNPQQLQLTQQEKNALVDFLRTLSGTNVYIDSKWSNPFR